MDFALSDDQNAIADMARSFGAERIAPNADAWEEAGTMPRDMLRDAAALGFAAMYVPEKHGGAGLSRLDAVLVFEALAEACPTISSFLSIHNMCAWMVATLGTDIRTRELPPRPPDHGAHLLLLPHRTRLRLRRGGLAHEGDPHR